MPIFTERKTTDGSIVSEVFIANEAAFSWDTLKKLSASHFLIGERELEDFLQPPALCRRHVTHTAELAMNTFGSRSAAVEVFVSLQLPVFSGRRF